MENCDFSSSITQFEWAELYYTVLNARWQEVFPPLIWNPHTHTEFPPSLSLLQQQSVSNICLDLRYQLVVIITCCFRTDSSKLRLPLGPPISSLSQGVRSSMEHKVGHHTIGFMYQHQEGPRYNCNWITRYVFMCHQCAIKVIATKANIQLW